AFPSVWARLALAGILVAPVRTDGPLALAALTIAPLLFMVNRHYRRKMRVQWRQVKELETSALSVVQEALGALRVVKAFGQERREQERFLDRSGQGMWARMRLPMAQGGFRGHGGLVTARGNPAGLVTGDR